LGDRIAGNVKDATGAIQGNESLGAAKAKLRHPYGAARQANNDVLGTLAPERRPAEAVC
jgi:uncharacterized protein YjbJ (UPF0337 family)